jgi:hypothetical protein
LREVRRGGVKGKRPPMSHGEEKGDKNEYFYDSEIITT